MTLEDVFIRKLKSDPAYVLDLSREFLEQGPGEGTFARKLIDKYVLSWMDENEEQEELGRRVLGYEFVNLLRPV